MPKNTTYTLALEFDVNQITRALQYRFRSKQENPDVKVGPLAGTFHFQVGDKVELSVTATGIAEDDISFSVTDCTIVSIGTANLGKFYLSPFSKSKAVSKISKWQPAKPVSPPSNGRVALVSHSSSDLEIKAPNGQWEISGYLSVKIQILGKTYYRVFSFDPEGTIGNGGGLSFP